MTVSLALLGEVKKNVNLNSQGASNIFDHWQPSSLMTYCAVNFAKSDISPFLLTKSLCFSTLRIPHYH